MDRSVSRLGRFADELEQELLLAHDRLQTRRRRRRGVVRAVMAAVALLAVGGGIWEISGDDPAAAAPVEIETLDDGTWQVTVIDPDAPIDEIEAVLREAGIEAEVILAATGPSRVVEVLAVAFTEGGLPLAEPGNRTFEIPSGYEGTVLISLGVEAEPGQPYDQPSVPFSRGEPFEDLPLAQRTGALAVYEAALERGLDVVLNDPDGRALRPHEGAEVTTAAILAEDVMVLNWSPGD